LITLSVRLAIVMKTLEKLCIYVAID
jgi:hypothetical protein